MSAFYLLECDEPGCKRSIKVRALSSTLARARASADGWRVHPRFDGFNTKLEDRCPIHVP